MNRAVILLVLFLLTGCVAGPLPQDPMSALRTEDGSVIWQDEYRFTPPEAPWKLLNLDESDYSIAFYLGCQDALPGNYPCESTMAYSEEPFGYSRQLEERQKEFFRRFLWAARVDFESPHLEQTHILDGNALIAETVGHERVLGHKVLARVVFARRGERVVAFYFTQWRAAEREFDRGRLEAFTRFIESFSFTRPSFYQRLMVEAKTEVQ